jgi:hypothetical protein
VCGISGLVTAIDLYAPSVKRWIKTEQLKSIRDDRTSAIKTAGKDQTKIKAAKSDYHDKIHSLAHDVAAAQKSVLVSTLVALLLIGFIAYATYRGRYWARWGAVGIILLTFFIRIPIGIASILTISADVPYLYRVPAFISGVLLVAAAVLTNLRPSLEYFAAHRPVAPAGGRAAGRPRRGLFAPPPPRDPSRGRTGANAAAKKPATTRPAAPAASDRSRSKRRADTAAVAKGADLARTRAKAAAKSRRTES